MIKVNELTKSREWRAEFVYEGATVSLPSGEAKGEYYERRWVVDAFFGEDHAGVEPGYVWLDLRSEGFGERKCAPMPVGTRLYVH